MRIIQKVLLALVFLAPAFPAAAQNLESRFLRIERSPAREPLALQTVVAKYVPSTGKQGVEVDLVAVVHIGEKTYYQQLNELFVSYDAVLYELVAPDGMKPPKDGEMKSDNPLAMLQQGMKYALRLEHQLELVNYHKANFIHADLSPEGLRKAMRERGDNEVTVAVSVFMEIMRKMSQSPDKSTPQPPPISLEDLLNPMRIRRMMAQQFEDTGGEAALGKTINQLLVEDRNKACMIVLHREIAAGKKRIAIFYGAAHMPDFEKRLRDELAMKRVSDTWLKAWNLADDGSRK